MRNTTKFAIVAALAASMVLPTAVQAIDLRINVGDRGYYTHGARYWNGDWEYIWVPGYRQGNRWVHGHYRRGERRRGRDRHHDRHDNRRDDHRHDGRRSGDHH